MKKANSFKIFAIVPIIFILSGCSEETSSAASTTGTSGSTSTTLGDSTPTGKIVAGGGFFILYDVTAAETIIDEDLGYTQTSVSVTINANDVNGLVEVSGQTVNFKAEWGQWLDEKDSCVLSNGQCSVTWRSGDPSTRPGSCRVAVTAWTEGEESFNDVDGDGLFETADVTGSGTNPAFGDLDEPFLDIDGNGVFTAGILNGDFHSELIDIENFDGASAGVSNGVHDAVNGLYDGSQCASANASCNPARTSMIIHARQNIIIANNVYDETADENGNGTPNETDILYCGANSF